MPSTDLTVFKENKLNSEKNILAVVQKNNEEIVRIQEEDLGIVDITKTMIELSSVGTLLMVADKTSDGFKCNVPVKKIMGGYQDFVKDCASALLDFKLKSKQALENHVDAVESLEDDDLEDALEKVGACKESSAEMATKAGELAKSASSLVILAQNALDATVEQDIVNQQQKREIELVQQKTKAEQAEAARLDELYKQEVAMYKKKEKAALARAEKESDKAFTIAIIGAVAQGVKGIASAVNPFGGDKGGGDKPDGAQGQGSQAPPPPVDGKQEQIAKLNSELDALKTELEAAEQKLMDLKADNATPAEDIQAQEKEIPKLKKQIKEKESQMKAQQGALDKMYDLAVNNAASAEANAARMSELLDKKRELEMNNKALMAKLAVEFSNNMENLEDVKISIEMIKQTTRALGMIRTALVKTQRFWEDQARACDLLTSLAGKAGKYLEKVKGAEEKKQADRAKKNFYKSIHKSGFTWLCLYKMNQEGSTAIEAGYKNINAIVCGIGGMESRTERLAEAKRVLAELADVWEKGCDAKALQAAAQQMIEDKKK